MSRKRGLGQRLANIDQAATGVEIARAQRELGTAAGPKQWVVVRVAPGETEAQAYTRAVALNPWVQELSPAAYERLEVIVISRNHTRSDDPQCQDDAWAEARALHLAGAPINEIADRSGYSELEVREAMALPGWPDGVSL